MPKKAEELSALAVKNLTEPGKHAVGNPAGLYLYVKDTGSRSWVLRLTVAGKRRHMGLGGYPDVPLAQARETARTARKMAREGKDPIREQNARIEALRAAEAKRVTFADATRRFLTHKGVEFRNPKHLKQWETTLRTYAFPIIGDLDVSDIELAHIVNILEPFWESKTETATRVRGRIESVLAWATVSGFREGSNPAAWKNNLDKVLAKPTKLKNVQHHAAVPIADAPVVFQAVRDKSGIAARALEFIFLTAARSGEVRGATWEEIDLQARTWTIPSQRMKAGREHVVPLTPATVELLERLPHRDGLLFPAPRGKSLAPESLTAVLRRMGRKETVHGLRSTFRDWTSERTSYAHEVAEQALAHTIASATERAYRRGSLLAKRSRLMSDWERYLVSPPESADVEPIRPSIRNA